MTHHRGGTAEPGGADEVAATRDALPVDHDELNQNSHLDKPHGRDLSPPDE